MKSFFKVDLAADGWGLLVNEGTVDEPNFRVLLKGTERWMERMATEMNSGNPGPPVRAELSHVRKPSFAKAMEGRPSFPAKAMESRRHD